MGDIVPVEASSSGRKGGLVVQFLDFGVEVIECQAQGSWELIIVGQQRIPLRSKDAQV